MIESAYETLKLPREASPEDVRRAYVRLVRRYPPEHFPERFAKIQSAYRTLCLDDDLLQQIYEQASAADFFPGFLWGDRSELKIEGSLRMEDLNTLIDAEVRAANFDRLLDDVAATGITWRDVNHDEA